MDQKKILQELSTHPKFPYSDIDSKFTLKMKTELKFTTQKFSGRNFLVEPKIFKLYRVGVGRNLNYLFIYVSLTVCPSRSILKSCTLNHSLCTLRIWTFCINFCDERHGNKSSKALLLLQQRANLEL